jgi:hypothetical protein
MFLSYRTLTLVAVAAFVGACSSSDTVDFNQVKEGAIHRALEAQFDAETSVLRIVAEGRVGGSTGTTVRYPEPATIKVNGEPMELCDGEQAHRGCYPLDEGLKPNSADSTDEAAAKVKVGELVNAVRNIGRGTYYFYQRKIAEPAGTYAITWKKEDGAEELLILPLAAPVNFAPGDAVAWQGVANVERKTETEKVALLVLGQSGELHPSLRRFSEVSQTPGEPLPLDGMLKPSNESTQALQFVRLRKGEIHDDEGNRQATFTAEYKSRKRHQLVGAAKNVTARD